jgi:Na+-translocating ferredoxin:NAD+ oxidoreductase RnfG subunit
MLPRACFTLLPVTAVAVIQPAHALVYMSIEQAQRQMFGNAALLAVPIVLTTQQIAQIERDARVKVVPGVLRAWKCDSGYFFVDAVIGKHDLITYAVAMSNDGAVRQVEILEYREAYGGEIRQANWRAQFAGRRHGDAVTIGKDIQNISGATLSSTHVTDGIRRLLAIHALALSRSD